MTEIWFRCLSWWWSACSKSVPGCGRVFCGQVGTAVFSVMGAVMTLLIGFAIRLGKSSWNQ